MQRTTIWIRSATPALRNVAANQGRMGSAARMGRPRRWSGCWGVQNGMYSTTKTGDVAQELEEAQATNNLVRILGIAREVKQAGPASAEEMRLVYRHLVRGLAHYGLWTPLYATVQELLGALPADQVGDRLWATILDGFVACGRSTDGIYAQLVAGRGGLGKHTLAALLRAAIAESNLSQAMAVLQTAIAADALPSVAKDVLLRLAGLFVDHRQTALALDLVHQCVLPLAPDAPPACLPLFLGLLRKAAHQSEPQATAYWFKYLGTHHPALLRALAEQDSGLMVGLLALASRHIQPELTLQVLAQLATPRGGRLQLAHLLPSVVCLCRSGGTMAEEAVKIVARMEPDVALAAQELEVLGFHLFLGHLGGLAGFRRLHGATDADGGRAEDEVLGALETLDHSQALCRAVLAAAGRRIHPDVLNCLVNSLVQANVELNRPATALHIFRSYLNPPSDSDSDCPPFRPNLLSFSLLQTAADRASDDLTRTQILDLILQLK